MIDLRNFLRKLDQSSVTWARRPPEGRWPCLSGEPDQGADAVVVRARLGNYQRALTRARKSLQRSNPVPGSRPVGASLFTTHSDGGADSGSSAERGGDL